MIAPFYLASALALLSTSAPWVEAAAVVKRGVYPQTPRCSSSSSHCIYIQGGAGYMRGQDDGTPNRCRVASPDGQVGYGACQYTDYSAVTAICENNGDPFEIYVNFHADSSLFFINGPGSAFWSSTEQVSNYAQSNEYGDDLHILCP